MDISIFGFKLNLEVLILIGIVYLILVIHTVCGCANFYGKMEGMENNVLTQPFHAPAVMPSSDVTAALVPGSPQTPTPAPYPAPTTAKKGAAKEGFVGANTNYGESSDYPSKSTILSTSKWGVPNLNIIPGKPIPKAAQAIINRPNQSLPLPDGQLSLFDNMPFSPKCCPNAYSSSMGCACMNSNTYNYLINRGGNNVPYSEY